MWAPCESRDVLQVSKRAKSRAKMEVGRTFGSFFELEAALEELRKNGCHPLRVFNSQTAKDYNKKRLSTKNPVEPVDTEKNG